jgi:hypothetical protein
MGGIKIKQAYDVYEALNANFLSRTYYHANKKGIENSFLSVENYQEFSRWFYNQFFDGFNFYDSIILINYFIDIYRRMDPQGVQGYKAYTSVMDYYVVRGDIRVLQSLAGVKYNIIINRKRLNLKN